jgi:hypothetical protein
MPPVVGVGALEADGESATQRFRALSFGADDGVRVESIAALLDANHLKAIVKLFVPHAVCAGVVAEIGANIAFELGHTGPMEGDRVKLGPTACTRQRSTTMLEAGSRR